MLENIQIYLNLYYFLTQFYNELQWIFYYFPNQTNIFYNYRPKHFSGSLRFIKILSSKLKFK